MTTVQLIERIEKNESKLVKMNSNLEKKVVKLEKVIDRNVMDILKLPYKEFYTIEKELFHICSYDLDDVRQVYNKIEGLKITISNQKEQLQKLQVKENKLVSIPKVLIDYKEYLIKTWDSQDKNIREFYRNEYKSLGYKNFIEKYKYREYEKIHISDEEIHKSNVKSADQIILNMIARTEEKVGVITDCTGLYIDIDNKGYSIINGTIIGEKGKVSIESILAGGYNIQRLHVRVLVK